MRLLLLALLLALATPATATATAERRVDVFQLGDSLAEGAAPYLPAALPGETVRTDAAVGRHAQDGARVLADGPRAATLLISLGTNDDPRGTDAFAAAIADVMRVAGSGRCVVWANIVRPPVAGRSYTAMNRTLRAEARRRGNLVVFRWGRMVARHPEWLARDGVHVDAAGYGARARGLARAAGRC